MKNVLVGLMLLVVLASCRKDTCFNNSYYGSMELMKNLYLPDTNFHSLDTLHNYEVRANIEDDILSITIENYIFRLPIDAANFKGNYFIDSTSNGGYFILNVEISNYSSIDLFLIDFASLPDSVPQMCPYIDRTEIKYEGRAN